MSANHQAPVLLFDGDCGLCNRIVRLLLRTDKAGRLRFAPLQGKAGQAYLQIWGLPTGNFDSLVFVPNWETPDRIAPLLRTDGVLAAAAVVGGHWWLVTWMRVLPGWLRDAGYKLVALTRYALFGQYRGEPLRESVEWRGRFL